MSTKKEVNRRTWRIGFWASNGVGLLTFACLIAPRYFDTSSGHTAVDSVAYAILVFTIVGLTIYGLGLLLLPGIISYISWDQSGRWGILPFACLFSWQCFYFMVLDALSSNGFPDYLYFPDFLMVFVALLPVLCIEFVFYALLGVISHKLVFFVWNRYSHWQAMRSAYHYFGLPNRKKEDPTVWPPPPSR